MARINLWDNKKPGVINNAPPVKTNVGAKLESAPLKPEQKPRLQEGETYTRKVYRDALTPTPIEPETEWDKTCVAHVDKTQWRGETNGRKRLPRGKARSCVLTFCVSQEEENRLLTYFHSRGPTRSFSQWVRNCLFEYMRLDEKRD